jgi:lipopolysaccharide/colanic/teichoic acid biosynthesis glycosyltransferase
MLRYDVACSSEHGFPLGEAQFASVELVPSMGSVYGKVKVLSDCLVALLMFILTAPLIILAAIVVKLTSRGPVFYSQVRLGRGGRPFLIYKIRTMRHNCENGTGAQWSKPGDTRITPIGRFLRKSHIDELPQLWNVLRGDMSLVGPRPERPTFVESLSVSLPDYPKRCSALPGITGLAQVKSRYDTSVDSANRKLQYDLYYLKNGRLLLDLKIMAATVKVMARGEGAH